MGGIWSQIPDVVLKCLCLVTEFSCFVRLQLVYLNAYGFRLCVWVCVCVRARVCGEQGSVKVAPGGHLCLAATCNLTWTTCLVITHSRLLWERLSDSPSICIHVKAHVWLRVSACWEGDLCMWRLRAVWKTGPSNVPPHFLLSKSTPYFLQSCSISAHHSLQPSLIIVLFHSFPSLIAAND